MPAVLPSPDWGDDVTDARYPERWLNDRRVRRLSDRAHRVYVTALTWSASNRTDGVIEPDDLGELPVVPDRALRDELVKSGLWSRDGQDIVMTEFESSQTTAAEMERLDRVRLLARKRKSKQRDGSRDVTRDHTGEDRQGPARTGRTTDTTTGDEYVDFPDPRLPSDDRLSARADEVWASGYDT